MVKDKSRVLIFSSSYLPVVGGMQTVAHNLAKQLICLGHDVRVVTNRYPVSLAATENLDGVTIERLLLIRPEVDQLRRKRPDIFLASLYFYPISYGKLRAMVRRFRPDVVNVHFPDHQIPFVLKLRREFDFRLVVSLHGHDIERAINGHAIRNRAQTSSESARALLNLRTILKQADAVTACSRDLLDKAIQVEPSISVKSQVIYNGIDPARFENKQPYEHPRPYIFAFGRFTKNKGFDLLIDAFAPYHSQSKADLILAGEGEEENALRSQVERLGLKVNVRFFGKATASEVVRLLNGCLGVVVPSRNETFGIVALEAIAAGKPVLATKVGGLQEFLLELSESTIGNGQSNEHPSVTLVEPTVEGITRGLSKLPTRAGQNGLANRLPEKFTWPRVARNYERVLVADS